MPPETDYFLSARPAWPWSAYPLGTPALVAVAAALVLLTLWAYLKHPAGTRRRIVVVMALRLAALAVALLTAVRPSVGIQENPKVPSTILIGVDVSESMTFTDELNNQSRLDAVKKTLARCQPLLDELAADQNVTVKLYAFGKTDFNEGTDTFTPDRRPDAKRSDYGVYLNRTLDKWQAERFIRGHLLIGDGIDNGTSYSAQAEAARWRTAAPVHTFIVGKETTTSTARDVAVLAASAEPAPVPVKNDVTIKAVVNAFGFVGAKVPVRILFDDKQVAQEDVILRKETGNEIRITVKAPDRPGEVRVKVEIPVERVPGDAAPANNTVETYMTVTKEGVRVLLVDRLRIENALLTDALRAEKRFDVVRVLRQRDDPATPEERDLFDFDARAYDVIILGNVSKQQLNAIDPNLMSRIREQVLTKGTGLLALAGDASFAGTPGRPLDNGWVGTPLEELLPVSLRQFPPLPPNTFTRDDLRFQTVPTDDGLRFLLKVVPAAADTKASADLWDRMNKAVPPVRLTAVARLGDVQPGATLFAVADPAPAVVPAGQRADALKKPAIPLLVGWAKGADGNPGRVLAFAGYDSFQWKAFGARARTRDGKELHAQFWRRLVLWLGKQEDEEGAAFARPQFRRINAGGRQTVRVGLRGSGGAELPNATFEVRVMAPGQKPEEAAQRAVVADPDGGNKIVFEPPVPGEYTVLVKASGKDAAGKEVKGEAAARFLTYAEASDELLAAAAKPDTLEALAKAGGGRAYRLEDLPQYLKEQKGQPVELPKKPRYLPDWRRDHSHGFLPGWLVLFVALVGTEWALRRLWGMV